MSGFSGTKNAVVTVVNVAKEVGGNLELIASRLYSSGLVSAANLLSSILSVSGTTTGAAVVTDNDGTLQQYLRGLVTLLLALNNLSDGPVLGTSVYLTVSGVSAELGADITAGEYLIFCTCDVTFAITAAGGGGSVVWATSPGIILSAGVFLPFRLTASQRIAAITTGGATGSLMILPVG